MSDIYNDVPVGLRVPSGIPLDAKLWVKKRSDLLLNVDTLGYTYYKGMRVYCALEREIYEWRPFDRGITEPYLLLTNFTYPAQYSLNGIVYDGEEYNFYKVPQAEDITFPDVPTLVSLGDGVPIYFGMVSGDHAIRTIKTQVTQPTVLGQLEGLFKANVSPDSSNGLVVHMDFSEITVPVASSIGIPAYYVNSFGNDVTGDGSIVKPYKTWDKCKSIIIGSGDFYNPDKSGVRVVFQTNISSTQDLTVANTTFNFENESIFTYDGSEDAAFDMLKIINSIGNPTSRNYFEGSGSIHTYSPIAIRAGGQNNISKANVVVIVKNSSITLRKLFKASKFSDGTFVISDDGYGNPLEDGGGNNVWVLAKVGGNEVQPMEGLLSIKGHNTPVWEPFAVYSGATLTIQEGINRAIYIQDGNLINYGTIVLDQLVGNVPGIGNITIVRYGTIDGSKPDTGRYTPSDLVSQITIDTTEDSPTSSASLATSGTGSISGNLLGSTRQGGYNAVVELKGKGSSFVSTSTTPLSWNDRTRFNYLVWFADTATNGAGAVKKGFNVRNIYTRARFEKFIFGGVAGISSANSFLSISSGDVESTNMLSSSIDKIYTPSISTALPVLSRFMLLAERIYINPMPSHANQTEAISYGLKPGMLYHDRSIDALRVVITP